MDTGNGRITDLTPEEEKKAQKEMEAFQKRFERLGGEVKSVETNDFGPMPKMVPITTEQEKFFKNKGLAFRALWAKRIARGLTSEQAQHLNELMENDKLTFSKD